MKMDNPFPEFLFASDQHFSTVAHPIDASLKPMEKFAALPFRYRADRNAFTLDGLKAFALFFLCFSRQQCRYALANLAPLGFANDTELFDFCKKLHIYQDFRNRAAHEGFHPEVREDINGIWTATAEIIAAVRQLQQNISQHEESIQIAAQKKRKDPIIVRKVS